MSYTTKPAGRCCDECAGTANPVAYSANQILSNPTVAAIECNSLVESPWKGKCCSGEGDKPEKGENPVSVDYQDECCSGNYMTKTDNFENVGKDECCSGAQGEAPKDNCQEECYSGKKDFTEKPCKDAYCPSEGEKELEGKCQNGCCAGGKEKAVEDKRQDPCCSGDDEKAADGNCQDECYSEMNEKSNERRDVPACCEGKSAPCCDASCIDQVAIRECESECGENPRGQQAQASGTACAYHKKQSRAKYAATLAALGCICRSLIALGKDSCCISKERITSRKGLGVRKSIRVEADGCRNTKSEVQGSACKRGCCEASLGFPREAQNTTGRSIKADLDSNDSINAIGTQVASADLEKGRFKNEHVALSIVGMTCTGCEAKLQKVLGTLQPVKNLKTSLVMARAEFDLDIAAMSLESVMKHLKRTTEFKCEQISTRGSNVEVIPSGDVKDFLDQMLPLGVNDMQLVGKDVVRINFDPKIIGVRSLIENDAKYPCRLAPPPTDPGFAAGSKHVRDMGYMTVLSSVLTIPVLVLAWAPLRSRPITYGAISLALATIIQVVIAGPFYPKALKSLIFSRMIEMDLLIVISTSTAYIFSVISFGYLVSGKPLSTGEFFETSTLLVTLIMIGRWVTALSRQRAIESISIQSLQTFMTQLVTADGTSIAEIDTRLLEYGDLFSVLPEHRIPTDGIVISGTSEIDESMLTGESRPIAKQIGSKVIAGSINGSGKLIVRLTHLAEENTISVIAGMVDNAKLSKPKIQDLADRVASYFVPVIIFLTIAVFVIWISVGVAIQNKSSSDAAIQATIFAITVLIVSCPCAIGLAVPMVIVIGTGVAAERGVIFKSADSIEMAYKATHVVFDKTGTLTEGKLKVVKKHYVTQNNITGRSMILGLVANSKHPVSAAVAAHLEEEGISAVKISNIKTFVGKGVEGRVDGKIIRGGNIRWLDAEFDADVQSILNEGHTVFCITLDSKLLAVFGLSDTIRPEATATINKLRQKGVHLSLLSGDETGAVKYIASQTGLNPDEARSRCSPGDKQQYIQELLEISVGRKKSTVIFVGDGTNDALALAQATIGVHMSSGTDIAQSAADVILMRPSLDGILTMIDISRAAVLRIKFNFCWSFIYNILALLFASGALVSAHKGTAIKIPPQYAGVGELVSVLPVVAIAVGLKWAKF